MVHGKNENETDRKSRAFVSGIVPAKVTQSGVLAIDCCCVAGFHFFSD
jgi:hypothetical protein